MGPWRAAVVMALAWPHAAALRAGRAASSRGMRMASSRVNEVRDAMQYRTLGDSDLKVSHVCLGTMTWGNQNTFEEAAEQLDAAMEYGVNFIDTAEMYPVPTTAETQGRTDLAIAQWLKSRKGIRDELVLATKVSGCSDRITWVRDHGRGTRLTRDDIVESVDKSLKRLEVDHVDLLQLHWPDRYVPIFGQDGYDPTMEREAVPIEEQLRGLEEVIKAGKVRYVGLSNETPWGVAQFVNAAEKYGLPKVVSIQNCYSLLFRTDYDNGLAEACAPTNANVPLLAYSPLAGGVLSGKYRSGLENAPDNCRLKVFGGFMSRYLSPHCSAAVNEYAAVAEAEGVTLTELALSWCYNRKTVGSSIIGATSMPQLRENMEALLVELSPEALRRIEDVHQRYRDASRYVPMEETASS